MKERQLSSFEDFEDTVLALLDEDRKSRGESRVRVSPVLFRGQASDRWKLETTLERYADWQYGLEKYYHVMRVIKPSVESCTGKNWKDLPAYSPEQDEIPAAPQGYEFMAYLRHNGFPSPLLDWTRSFYVAAFFAFQDTKGDAQNVAIYSYIEYGNGGKEGSGAARIGSLGPTIRTDERHFLQQSEYTFCSKPIKGFHGDRVYCSHEEVFALGREDQDILTKFTIPRAERPKVLDRLRMMNITAYSLFNSEESLLKDLAYEEIERRSRRRVLEDGGNQGE